MSFHFTLERLDGSPVDPPTITSAVPDMRPGDTIPLGRGRTLCVVRVREDEDSDARVLVVEDTS